MRVPITAKVRMSAKTAGSAGNGSTMLSFYPDYADDRNKAWAVATPALNLTMTVKDEIADGFVENGAYTLTFTLDES